MGMVKWLGVRWAAKEAAFKAFGTRRGGLVWGDVEVGYYDSGWSLFFSFFREGRGGGGLICVCVCVCLGQPFLWLFRGGKEGEEEGGAVGGEGRGRGRERRRGGLSISHDGEYLVAMAMI